MGVQGRVLQQATAFLDWVYVSLRFGETAYKARTACASCSSSESSATLALRLMIAIWLMSECKRYVCGNIVSKDIAGQEDCKHKVRNTFLGGRAVALFPYNAFVHDQSQSPR